MTTPNPNLSELRRLAEGATPHQWVWHTSNSWRRLKAENHGVRLNVLEPFVASDGHPDLTIDQSDMNFIAACNPATILALLDMVEAQAALQSNEGGA
jgi:hypothetical protein